MSRRPIAVWVIALLYIAVGSIGFVAHWSDLRSATTLRSDGLVIEITELVALVSGAFMLRAKNWARWLAVAWMAFHVVVSAFDGSHGLIVHCVFLALIAWAVFRSESSRYFQAGRIGTPPTSRA